MLSVFYAEWSVLIVMMSAVSIIVSEVFNCYAECAVFIVMLSAFYIMLSEVFLLLC